MEHSIIFLACQLLFFLKELLFYTMPEANQEENLQPPQTKMFLDYLGCIQQPVQYAEQHSEHC